MNIFYAPPDQIECGIIELSGQEAIHASKALRYKPGDNITVVDGKGGWYEGEVRFLNPERVQIAVNYSQKKPPLKPVVVLAMGIIKKRDRLEFAVEKAVELGVSEIVLFRSEHGVKQNIRRGRVESVMIAAMKQSLQAWLPDIKICNGIDELLQAYSEYSITVAHETADRAFGRSNGEFNKNVLLAVGPEGGFSPAEIERFKGKNARLVSLGSNRLRTETAAVTFLSRYHCWGSSNRS